MATRKPSRKKARVKAKVETPTSTNTEETVETKPTEEKPLEKEIEEAVSVSNEEGEPTNEETNVIEDAAAQEDAVDESDAVVESEPKSPLLQALEDYVTETITGGDVTRIGQTHGRIWIELSKVVVNPNYQDFRKGWIEYLSVVNAERERAFADHKPFVGTNKPAWPYDPASAKAYNILTTIAVNGSGQNREIFLGRLDIGHSLRSTALENNATAIQNLTQFYYG